jgi:ABC-2 type transport system permease protein
MIDLIAAEWLKLRTTRLLLGVIPVAIAISCAAVAGSVLTVDDAKLASTPGIRHVFSVTGAGVIVVLVLGILVAAGEYRHDTIADTFVTTPRRHRVVAAKLTVGAGLGVVAGVLLAGASVGIAGVLYRSRGVALPFGDAELWLTLAGTVAYTTLFAVLGVAVGCLVRNQVLAVAGALAWFAIVEHTLVNLVPSVGRWLPAGAGQAILRTPLDGLLSPVAGTVVLAMYAATIAAAGIRAEATRDV